MPPDKPITAIRTTARDGSLQAHQAVLTLASLMHMKTPISPLFHPPSSSSLAARSPHPPPLATLPFAPSPPPMLSTRGTPAWATSQPLSLNHSDRKCPAGWIFPRKARGGRKAYGCCPLSSGWQGLWCCILPRQKGEKKKERERERDRKIACLGFGKSQATPCSE